MTKTALADFAGLQECYVRQITKARRNPTVTVVYALCEVLGIAPSEFFRRVSEEMEGLRRGG